MKKNMSIHGKSIFASNNSIVRSASGGSGAAVGTAAVTVAAAVAYVYNRRRTTFLENNNEHETREQQRSSRMKYKIPIDFMDRLANKPYLKAIGMKYSEEDHSFYNYHLSHHHDNRYHHHHHHRQRQHRRRRPPGVPKQLRILTVDLQSEIEDYNDVFVGGICRLSSNHVFPPHVAPPKKVQQQSQPPSQQQKNNHNSATSTRNSSSSTTHSVPQKVFVQSLVQCMTTTSGSSSSPTKDDDQEYYDAYQTPKVQIMQASIADLNPNNVRRARQFGNLYKYDPGKYTRGSSRTGTATTNRTNNPMQQQQNEESSSSNNNHKNNSNDKTNVMTTEEFNDITNDMDLLEMDAPWNQYAWMEELQLRISGRVKFGAPMEPSSSIGRYFFGNVYKSTVPASRRTIWDKLFFFLPTMTSSSSSSSSRTTPPHASTSATAMMTAAGAEGMDHDAAADDDDTMIHNNWASHKPHAVIANGAALQRVPTSLALLQRVCYQSNVPLYVINDPRVWGGNTHITLDDAIYDMKKQIKHNILTHAIQQQIQKQFGFTTGRMIGRLETEWIRYYQRIEEEKKRKKQSIREKRWGSLHVDQLEQKFIEYGILLPSPSQQQQQEQQQQEQQQQQQYEYSPGMKEFIRRQKMSSSSNDKTTMTREKEKKEKTEEEEEEEVEQDSKGLAEAM